jgi:hypothetical protein
VKGVGGWVWRMVRQMVRGRGRCADAAFAHYCRTRPPPPATTQSSDDERRASANGPRRCS